tara:strand:- start:14 stop:346 length:333 start_codon:yes stop_codon:yes gene_type:complete
MAKKDSMFNLSKYMKTYISLASLEMISRTVLTLRLPNAPPALTSILGISISLSRIAIIKSAIPSMPFGLKALLTGIIGLSSMQMIMAELPQLMEGFGGFLETGTSSEIEP